MLEHSKSRSTLKSDFLDKKSRIRETKNLSTDADSRTDTIKFFHQEIAGDGHALRGDRQASRSPRRAHPSPAIS